MRLLRFRYWRDLGGFTSCPSATDAAATPAGCGSSGRYVVNEILWQLVRLLTNQSSSENTKVVEEEDREEEKTLGKAELSVW